MRSMKEIARQINICIDRMIDQYNDDEAIWAYWRGFYDALKWVLQDPEK